MDLLAAMRIYVRVVERGSISGAAKDLGMGQPAVSERIDKLEKFLGAKLLMRNARSLATTSEGETFYKKSGELISAAAEAISQISHAGGALDGIVRIAAAQCFGEMVVPQVLERLRAKHPQLKIDLVLKDSRVDPVTEGVDISLRLGELGNGGFIAHPIGKVHRMLVASPSFLAEHGPIGSPSDVANHPFIRVKEAFANEQLPLMTDGGIIEHAHICTAVTVSHWRPMLEMIEKGCGIGVVQSPGCYDSLRRGLLVRLLAKHTIPPFPVNALVQGRAPHPPRVRAVLELLKREIPAILDVTNT
jgi:DNA-binding transcriptional LysR family regulator